jgi:hypothetical protein
VRVIYFYHDADMPLYLLMIYAKARQEDLSADEKPRGARSCDGDQAGLAEEMRR